jgi:hypothetical protein
VIVALAVLVDVAVGMLVLVEGSRLVAVTVTPFSFPGCAANVPATAVPACSSTVSGWAVAGRLQASIAMIRKPVANMDVFL